MPIFKLKKEKNSIENAILIPAKKTSLELEKHLESWLENSPWAVAQEPLLIIGRQTSAFQEEYGTIFPDLLGIDKEGNLVIIELKKGRTPREVIAQLLEYAAWANDLSDEKIHEIATSYFKIINSEKEIDIATALAGSGPAYLALIAEALADGAVKQGLKREDAMTTMKGLFSGFGELIQEMHPALLKDAVMSPGGTTAAGYGALEDGNVRAACIDAIEQAYERAKKL